MRPLRPAMVEAGRHDALNGVALTARNSHRIHPRLPGPTRRSRSRHAWAVAREGMGWEQSPLTRTIAASRNDNRDEPPARDSRQAATIDHDEQAQRPGEYAQRSRY